MGLITPSKSRVLPFLFGVSLASVLFGGAAYYHQVQSALGMEKASAGDATTNWGRCEDRGWTTIKDEATCRLAATLNKGSYDNDQISSMDALLEEARKFCSSTRKAHAIRHTTLTSG